MLFTHMESLFTDAGAGEEAKVDLFVVPHTLPGGARTRTGTGLAGAGSIGGHTLSDTRETKVTGVWSEGRGKGEGNASAEDVMQCRYKDKVERRLDSVYMWEGKMNR